MNTSEVNVNVSEIDAEAKALSEGTAGIEAESITGDSAEDKSSRKKLPKKKKKDADKDMKAFISYNWSWLLAVAIALIFMAVVMKIMEISPFGNRSFTLVDSMHQYVPFFSDFREKLLSGESLSYTWDVGMGQNFQTLMLYYMASPLNLIIVLFTKKGIVTAMSVIIALKIATSAGCFGYFLSRRKDKVANNPFITVFALAYALNNYMCGYYWNIMWLDSIMVLPLIILGYERLMKRHDPRLYILALFVSFFCNYYISFMICIFLVLWFLTTEHKQSFIGDGLRFAGASLLTAGMAAMSLLMAYLAIMKTASASASAPAHSWYGNIFTILKKHIFLTYPINSDTFDGNANLYCGTFVYLLFVMFIFSTRFDIKEKLRKSVLIVLMVISMNETVLNYVWHGFHDQYGIPNRFAFMYIFALLVIGYETVTRLKNIDTLMVTAGFILTLAFPIICNYFSELEGALPARTMMLISEGLILLYSVLILLRCHRVIPFKLSTLIIATLFGVEIIAGAYISFTHKDGADCNYYMSKSDAMDEATDAVDEMAEKAGYIGYREDIIDPIMIDENTFENMRSIGTFCTTVRGDMVDTMARLGFYTGANEYIYWGATDLTNDMLGVRYIYTQPDKYFDGSEYELVYSENDIEVYENTDALSIAYPVSSDILNWSPTDYNSADQLNQLARLTAGVDGIFEDVYVPYAVTGTNCTAYASENSSTLINYVDGAGTSISISVSFTIDEPGVYYVNTRANYMQSITYYVNGEELASGRYQTQMMALGTRKAGDLVTLTLNFSSGYSSEGTVSMFLSRQNDTAIQTLNEKLSENQMVISEFDEGYIEGDVLMSSDQVLFTSIPYDEGWRVYDYGREVEVTKVLNSFLGVELGTGRHELTFKYVPPGRGLGLFISIICWIIFIAIWMFGYSSLGEEKVLPVVLRLRDWLTERIRAAVKNDIE